MEKAHLHLRRRRNLCVESIWAELPEDLVEEIMKRLPFECLFRFRIVSKGWKRLLGGFCAAAAKQQPCLLICMPNAKMGCLCYSFFTRAWRTLSFSFLDPLPESCSVKGSGAGLLLLDCTNDNSVTPCACLCNPLKGTSFQLPAITFFMSILAGWVVRGKDRGSYKVLVMGKCGDDTIAVQVYNSLTNSWKMEGHDLDGNSWAIKREEMVVCKGSVFCMGAEHIIVFNSEESSWSRVSIPAGAVATNNVWPRLVACGSSLVLVRLIKRGYVLKNVMMWELIWEEKQKQMSWRWQEKGRMPESLRGSLVQRMWIECVGVGDYV